MRWTGILVATALLVPAACGDSDGDSTGDDAAADSADGGGGENGGGDNGGSGGDDTALVPCDLLSADDVSAEFGDVGPVGDGGGELADTCEWAVGEVIDDPAGDGGTVYLTHANAIATNVGGTDADAAAQTFADLEAADADSDMWDAPPVDVDGLGDGAYSVEALTDTFGGQSHGLVMVLDGDVVFSVSAVFIPAIDDSTGRLEALAATALENM